MTRATLPDADQARRLAATPRTVRRALRMPTAAQHRALVAGGRWAPAPRLGWYTDDTGSGRPRWWMDALWVLAGDARRAAA